MNGVPDMTTNMTGGMSARELVEEELIHGALRREQLWKMIGLGGAGFGVLGCLAAAAVALTVMSANVWEAVLGNPKGSAPFPYSSPAIFSMTLAFFTIWLVSILDNSEQAKKERALFPDQLIRSETGLGASTASSH